MFDLKKYMKLLEKKNNYTSINGDIFVGLITSFINGILFFLDGFITLIPIFKENEIIKNISKYFFKLFLDICQIISSLVNLFKINDDNIAILYNKIKDVYIKFSLIKNKLSELIIEINQDEINKINIEINNNLDSNKNVETHCNINNNIIT